MSSVVATGRSMKAATGSRRLALSGSPRAERHAVTDAEPLRPVDDDALAGRQAGVDGCIGAFREPERDRRISTVSSGFTTHTNVPSVPR
jgi:hypothetical protein